MQHPTICIDLGIPPDNIYVIIPDADYKMEVADSCY